MKLIVIFFTLTTFFFGSSVYALAQNTSDTFQLGNKQIVIPAPTGFTESASQSSAIKDRFTATEAETNDMLAVHVPNEHFQLLKKGSFVDLTFYTKVSVSKSFKNLNLTQANFTEFVEIFKKNFPELSDPKGVEMKNTMSRISKNLSDLNKEKLPLCSISR